MLSFMNEYEKNVMKFIVSFLKNYEDVLGRQCCNDFYLKNTEANWELYKNAVYYNGDPEEIKYIETTGRPDPEEEEELQVLDFEIVMACRVFLENKLNEDKK